MRSLFKRHIGRRVAGVGVGVALLVLGLQAPAFAAPTIASFTPTSGPADCVVVVTGTGFLDFAQASQVLSFVDPANAETVVPQAEWTRISGTEIWTMVPETLLAGTSYNIRFDDPASPAVTSTATFLSTAAGGACAPTVTSFTPTCGSAGDIVTITGTNLIGPGLVGAVVRFAPYSGDAATVQPDVDTPTTLKRIVPTGVTDGPIRATTFSASGGQVFSATNFLTPPPDCPTAVGHTRSISLKLKDKLVAKGTVKSTEDPAFTDCAASVPVKIQKKKSGSWKTVGKTTTSDTGAYSKKIKNKKGKYRSIAVKTTLEGGEVCLKAKSPVRTH